MRTSHEWLVKKILDAIPYDHWVCSQEIADKVGVSSRTVTMLIRSRLLYEHVERKQEQLDGIKRYIYRRLTCFYAFGQYYWNLYI